MQASAAGNGAFTRFWTGEIATVLAYQMTLVAIGDVTRGLLDRSYPGKAVLTVS